MNCWLTMGRKMTPDTAYHQGVTAFPYVLCFWMAARGKLTNRMPPQYRCEQPVLSWLHGQ